MYLHTPPAPNVGKCMIFPICTMRQAEDETSTIANHAFWQCRRKRTRIKVNEELDILSTGYVLLTQGAQSPCGRKFVVGVHQKIPAMDQQGKAMNDFEIGQRVQYRSGRLKP